MANSLKNKLVVITGASSGIGEKTAWHAAKRGAVPVLLARREAKLSELSQKLQSECGIAVPYYQLDVQDTGRIEAVFREILQQFGCIDVLVNNAGFGVFNTVEDASLDEMRRMFEVNVYGLVACTKMVLPAMKNQGSGHIINIASIAGKMATPKSSLYSATKHAVLGFTDSLRMETRGSGISVTAVNPGPIKTDFFQTADKSGEYTKNVERWMLDADQVAEAIVKNMLKPKREISLPRWMNAGSTLYRVFPGLVEKAAGRTLNKK
ncbi:SDR family oxidoreductase [Metabacillus sp. GX 13764]|uniref:SDR family NAD(P)-dependent oxidoreductase n=1 Tax=Metabacillus kandeliae TaxID=2900151 RepID=UPI001E335578|nr:SDR family oxidoreductase [Metabacillus kandeliae]